MTRYTLSAALAATLRAPMVLLTVILLAGGVHASTPQEGFLSVDKRHSRGTTEAPVAAPSGIWKEVLEDGRSVSIFEPRDPGPCSDSNPHRPCLDRTLVVEPPTEVPLPGAVWGLVVALGALTLVKGRNQ